MAETQSLEAAWEELDDEPSFCVNPECRSCKTARQAARALALAGFHAGQEAVHEHSTCTFEKREECPWFQVEQEIEGLGREGTAYD